MVTTQHSCHTGLAHAAGSQHHDLHRLVGLHAVQERVLRDGDQQEVARPAAVHVSRARLTRQPHLARLYPGGTANS